MKKIIVLNLLIVGLFAMSAIGGDFRKVNWGMTVEEVKATEKPKIGVEDSSYCLILSYDDTVGGLGCKTRYIFVNDSSETTLVLVRGRYSFTDPVWANDQFFWDYKAIKEAVTDKYGEPFDGWEGWTPETATEPAAKSSDVSYLWNWQTSSTHISLGLEGYKDKWSFMLEYSSKELKNLEDKALNKQDDLEAKAEAKKEAGDF